MNPDIEQTNLWNADQLAQFLGCHPGHVRRLCSRKLIPHVKIKRLVRFNPKTIERWIERNTIEERRQITFRRRE